MKTPITESLPEPSEVLSGAASQAVSGSDTDLIAFAREFGPGGTDYSEARLAALSGDAGFRRYYRLSSVPSLMVVDSPPDKERNLEYVRTNNFLSEQGIRVPHIHAVDFERGVFVLEDLGDTSLQQKLLDQGRAGGNLYGAALDMLFAIQSITKRPDWLEDYSPELMRAELALFQEWFVQELLGIEVSAGQQDMLDRLFDRLVTSAQEQPRVFVHRDFHCRNIMAAQNVELSEEVTLAAIDFQDAVWGPLTYDLVSLCRDCYLRWDRVEVDRVVRDYGQRLASSGLLDQSDLERLPIWFDLMGLQRHIKVLGIFARLNIRDQKPGYLDDLPLVLRYTLEILASYSQYAEFSELYQWMLRQVVPQAQKQSWYQDWREAGD